ncbi:hypothetical protein [Dyadobacter diqingensis]|uniref:hypothetical protein n=1 Tax=Dyadobacter diqingensis TaxID=2938121 RepID=UPI0020C5A41C|nr:hypothetical protein [Dyadobacter diqingensis]
MKQIQNLRGLLNLSAVGCHCASNISYAYSVFGFDIHIAPLAIGIVAFSALSIAIAFGKVEVKSKSAVIILDAIEICLFAMILIPFFIDNKGSVIDISNADFTFWQNILYIIAGNLIIRGIIYIISNSDLK